MGRLILLFALAGVARLAATTTLYVPDGTVGTSSNGNVGVGTSNPSQKLEVSGQILASDSVNSQGSNAGFFTGDRSTSGTSGFYRSGGVSRFWNSTNGDVITYNSSANVGIGTGSPGYRLDVVDGFTRIGGYNTTSVPASDSTHGGMIVGWNRSNGGAEVNLYNAFDSFTPTRSFVFSQKTGASTYTDIMTLTGTGEVGIGTYNPGSYKLAVVGKIRAQEVVVDTGWSDYVFADDYRLAPLSEVEQHIKAEKHLPGIPSAAEVEQGGISLGQMQARLLAKIEELTLHQIAQEKKLDALQNDNRSLRADNADLRQELRALKQAAQK